MQKSIVGKSIVVGLLLLLVGGSFVSAFNGIMTIASDSSNRCWLYVDHSQPGDFSTTKRAGTNALNLQSQKNQIENLCVTTSTTAIDCKLYFSKEDLLFSTVMDYDIIEIKDCDSSHEPGKPLLPVKNIRVALPLDMMATSVRILDTDKQILTGSYLLLPAQQPQKTNTAFNESEFIQPAADVYFSHELYPSEQIQITGHCDLAGQVMVDIALYPLQYILQEQQVILTTSITFTIEGNQGYSCGDYLPVTISDHGREMYQQMIEDMVINPEQVTLRSAPHPPSRGVPPGSYEYVIITQDSWVSAFQPLADWKTKKGVPATIMTTSWIYNTGGYSGTNVEKIRSFVIDAHNNWGTVYFLLGGDTDVIPCHYRTFSSVDPDPVPNDTYYADYDSDWICEVHVGRASVTGPGSGSGQIGNFINKILNYEKNPPLTSFAKNAAFFGFDLDSTTQAQQCKITIDNNYVPPTWTMTNVYDSHPGNHKDNVITAINAGQNLMNHADHSGEFAMGVGYTNHGWILITSDMDNLYNSNKQGILYSMGCLPAAYDYSNCIAEHFVRNSNGGGVAFIGNSRYGWYNPGTYNTLSMKYDQFFFKSLFPENNYKLGACFSDHKNDAYQSDIWGHYKYIFTELTLLGDPEMPIWTENPLNLTASHPAEVSIGPSSFSVSVTSDGTPVHQAYVCVWKGNEIYDKGMTNLTGDVTFTILPASAGLMYVTVTKQNFIPFESTAQVDDVYNSPPQFGVPSPVNGSMDQPFSFIWSIPISDPEGDLFDWSIECSNGQSNSGTDDNNGTKTLSLTGLAYSIAYTVWVNATDSNGSGTFTKTWYTFTTQLDEIYITDLSEKWNFISLPFNQTMDTSNLLVKYNGSQYSWQEAVNQEIIIDSLFRWNRTKQEYQLATTLIPGQGYWMFAYHDCTLWGTGVTGVVSDTFVTNLSSNWNIIGVPDFEPVEKQNLFIKFNGTMLTWEEAVNTTIIVGSIFQWDDSIQTYLLTDILQPGKSYWMFAYFHCILLRPTI